jgi:hypothetical protein
MITVCEVIDDETEIEIQLPYQYGPIRLSMADAAELYNGLLTVDGLRSVADKARWHASQAKAIEILRNAAMNLTNLADAAEGKKSP